MVKVLYDYQIFTKQKYGGISRYFYEIIRNGRKDIVKQISILIYYNAYIRDVFNLNKFNKNLFLNRNYSKKLLNRLYR
ncbi:MAG: hypothetical protein FXF47_10140 [Candidatus Mcinerneyibacterium aminivorans]|uniref:Uncharacterized protein n=1 Tax=Candidatus Mcinerneyibacterium aminivorans TaxID=2703815 RepID=A0A5D0MEF1_9BACT|nr:MAG: hypothetical protein FXF47_10140 [Candidatus Mcinerneyibacterium aminivorans]